MATLADLGKAQKQAHPGAYEDVEDAALGAAVKAKYPGQYDDIQDAPSSPGPWASGYIAPKPATAAPKQPPNFMNPQGEFADNMKSSFAKTVGGVIHAATHPVETAENMAAVVGGLNRSPAPAGSWQHDVAQPTAAAVGDYYKDRIEHPLHTMYTDPLGAAADIGAIAAPAEGFLRGGAELADVANAARTASAMRTAADVSGAVSDYSNIPSIAGKAAGYGASKAIGAFTGIRSGLSPLESAAVDYALKDPTLQPTVDVGTATGNKAVAAQKSLLRKFPTSAGVMGDAEMAQKAAIRTKMDDIPTAIAPGGPTQTFTSGQQTLAAIKKQLNDYSATARDAFENRLYGAAESNPQQVQTGVKPNPTLDPNAPNTIPVFESIPGPTSMTAVKAAAAPMLEQIRTQMRASGTASSPMASMLEDIVNGPDVVSLRTAKDAVSTIQTVARNEAGVMRTKAQALSSQLIQPLRSAIDDAAQAVGPDAYQALQDGNAATVAKYDLAAAIPKTYLKRDVPPSDLVQLHDLLTKGEDAQFPALQRVSQHVPQALPGIARTTIEDIFRGTTEGGSISKVQTAINKWNALGPQTKQLLFGPDATQEIGNLLEYAKMATNEANPSGTAPTAQIMGLWALMAHNPLAAIGVMAGARGLAKGIMSPEMAATVRTTGRVPLPSMGAAGKAITAPVSSPGYLNVGRAVNDGIAQRMGRAIAAGQQEQQ